MRKLKFLSSEKNFLILLVALVVILNLVPFFVISAKTPPGKTYVGSYPIFFDKPTYLSKMQQGLEGDWKMIDQFTSEPQEPAAINIFYLFLGKLAKIFSASLDVVFLISRFFCGVVLILTVILAIRHFIEGVNQRKMAYFLVFFASGLGIFIPAVRSIDMWIPDMMPAFRFFYFPHMMLANALLILIVILASDLAKRKNFKKAASAGILTFILNLVLPFHSFLIYLLVPTYLLLEAGLAKNRGAERGQLSNLLVFLLISLPSFIFVAYIGTANPLWRLVERQNVLPTPSIIEVLLGCGLLLFFALTGIVFMVRSRHKHGFLFLSWICFVFALAYSPLPMQRRALETALYVPLAITGSFYLKNLYSNYKKRDPEIAVFKFANVFIWFLVFLLVGNAVVFYNLMDDIAGRLKNYPGFFIDNQNIEAMKWLRDNTPPGAVVFSHVYDGNLIPYYGDRIVYVGHSPETLDVDQKLDQMVRFYSGLFSAEEAARFFKEKGVGYVFFSDVERGVVQGKFDPSVYNFLKVVYQKGGVTIYKTML